MIDTDWDIDSYKTHHESDEHWELRRKFMDAHKERLPEDELVCLAQVFTNIEFLGCRYPNETMIRVAELAQGVVEEFREKKKNTLKRTFVAASDAASSKVKGIRKNNFNTDSMKEKEVIPIDRCKTAYDLLVRSIQSNRTPNCSFDKVITEEKLVECSVTMAGIKLSSAVSVDRKAAQELASHTALEKLREQCYTILQENELVGQNVEKSDFGNRKGAVAKPEPSSAVDNIGSKMMKLMGWAGGGLGSDGQGRVEPVEAMTTLRRAGFGSTVPSQPGKSTPKLDLRNFRKDITKYLHKWLADGAQSNLLFSTDFEKEERQVVHQIACYMGLKSKSYGKKDRRIVVSKKLSLWDLAQELHEAGGQSDKYKLLKPGEPLPPSEQRNNECYC